MGDTERDDTEDSLILHWVPVTVEFVRTKTHHSEPFMVVNISPEELFEQILLRLRQEIPGYQGLVRRKINSSTIFIVDRFVSVTSGVNNLLVIDSDPLCNIINIKHDDSLRPIQCAMFKTSVEPQTMYSNEDRLPDIANYEDAMELITKNEICFLQQIDTKTDSYTINDSFTHSAMRRTAKTALLANPVTSNDNSEKLASKRYNATTTELKTLVSSLISPTKTPHERHGKTSDRRPDAIMKQIRFLTTRRKASVGIMIADTRVVKHQTLLTIAGQIENGTALTETTYEIKKQELHFPVEPSLADVPRTTTSSSTDRRLATRADGSGYLFDCTVAIKIVVAMQIAHSENEGFERYLNRHRPRTDD